MSNPLKIACFGEVLWDVFPSKVLLGGAPLNVAMRLRSLGCEVEMISAVGNDDLGEEAIEMIRASGVNTQSINRHATLPTGRVIVTLENGQPSYTIDSNVAWDEIDIDETVLAEMKNLDALVFGSLALRNEYNKETLLELLKAAAYSVFDLNLRPPFYSEENIIELMKLSQLVKMNDEELEYICEVLKIDESDLKSQIREIASHTNTSEICVTLGSSGAIYYNNGHFYEQTGFQIEVADTVGAGDSFLAALVFEILSKSDPQRALRVACAYGALVASKEGANCEVTAEEIALLFS